MTTNTQQKAAVMLQYQHDVNTLLKPDWKASPPPYLRAAFIEAGECIGDHLAYKWWKHQVADIPQAVMEVVDITHFYLSHMLVSHGFDVKSAAREFEEAFDYIDLSTAIVMFDNVTYKLSEIDLIRKVELLAGLAIARRISLPLLRAVMVDLDMSFDDLFKLYCGKNALNSFRNKHGYTDGTYVKIWSGKEDNEYLTAILDTITDVNDNFFALLFSELDAQYKQFALNQ